MSSGILHIKKKKTQITTYFHFCHGLAQLLQLVSRGQCLQSDICQLSILLSQLLLQNADISITQPASPRYRKIFNVLFFPLSLF